MSSSPEGPGGGITGRWARVPWRRLTRRRVYQNPWIEVLEDEVLLPDGSSTPYGVVQCGDAVGVLPMLDSSHLVLVGQWRYVAEAFFWEIPTGGAHPGESLEAAAQRELAEEAGFEAGRLTRLCDFHSSKSVVRETATLYLAEELRPAQRPADPTEFIETRIVALHEALEMVERSEIKDAMSVIALLHLARRQVANRGVG